MERLNLYCFSGLGADERVFQFLELNGVSVYHVPWITPEKDEDLEDYSGRLALSISPKAPYAFLGVSFGGMVAQEVSKHFNPDFVFVISSASSSHEIPRIFRLVGNSGLLRFIPNRWFKRYNILIEFAFGVKEESERNMLKSIIESTDIQFLKWALRAICKWKGTRVKIIRIHGDKDKLIPFPKAGIDFAVKNGSHFMIVQNSREISAIICDQLSLNP